MDDTVTLPFRRFSDEEHATLFMASEEQRIKLIQPLFDDAGLSQDDIPEAWRRGPLSRWCWLVLMVNEIEFDPLVQYPLVHFGIDLGFSSTEIRQWVFTLA